MRLFAIDIGGRNTLIGEWIKDRYQIAANGVSTCIQCDSGKGSFRTAVLLNNKEVFVGDHVGPKISAAPDSCVVGCFQYFQQLNSEDLALENQFSPCAVETSNNLTQFILAAGGEPKKPLSFLVPVSFLFEYIFYLSIKNDKDLYYQRYERSLQSRKQGNVYSIVVPESFTNHELSLLDALLNMQNDSDYQFVRTSLAAALEFGYYNMKRGEYDEKPCRVLFIDSGAIHTNIFVVLYKKDYISIEYSKDIDGVDGRHYDLALFQYICGEIISELSIHSRTMVRCLENIERAKCNANMEGIDEFSVDLSVIDTPEFEDEVFYEVDDFHKACKPINEVFKGQFVAILEDLKKHDLAIDRVVPIGGSSRILTLREVILDSMKTVLGREYQFTQTVNVDECVVVGGTLFTYLVSENQIIFDGRASEYMMPFKQLKAKNPVPYDDRSVHVAIGDLITIHNASCYELTKDDFSSLKSAIDTIHDAEKELHGIHDLCMQAESLYLKAQKLCPDLSFFVLDEPATMISSSKISSSKISKKSKKSAKKWSYKQVPISGKYFPPCEYKLMCILQKEAKESGHVLALPTWSAYEEESVEWLLKSYEEGMVRDFVQAQEVAKRIHMSKKLATLYPHIQYLASLIHRVQMFEEQKSGLFTSLNKMIYATPRIKLNTEELKKNMINARDLITAFESEDEIKKRFAFLKRSVTH